MRSFEINNKSMSQDQIERVVAATSGAVMAICTSIKSFFIFIIYGAKVNVDIDYNQLVQVSLNAAVGAIVGLSVKWVWDKIKHLKNNK